MNVYLDASAMVKSYVAEAGSTEVRQLMTLAGLLATSLLSRVEVPAAIAKAARVGWVPREKALAVVQVFRVQWPDFICVQATEALITMADSLAWEQGLRGFDAVHLASALTWQGVLGESVTLATYDKQLWEAASRVGLDAWPKVTA
jgi:predicted nucleic acid-binding protein